MKNPPDRTDADSRHRAPPRMWAAVRRVFVRESKAGARSPAFEVVAAASGAASIGHLARSLTHGDRLAVVLPAGHGAARVFALVVLPGRLRRIERLLERHDFELEGRYALSPTLGSPWLAYQLETGAASYAERSIMGIGGGAAPVRWIQRRLRRWAGVAPTVGGVVVVGSKR